MRGLSFAQLRASLARRLKVGATADAQQAQIDEILDERFAQYARHLSWRVAAAIAASAPDQGQADGLPLATWEQAFAKASEEVLSPANQLRLLELSRRQLTRIEYEIAEFDEVDAAREARCCVVDDGMALADLARQHGYAHREQCQFVDELPPAWSAALNASAAGAVPAPVIDNARILLLSPRRYLLPTLDQPEIRARVEAQLVQQHFDLLAATHVRWHLRFGE